MIFAFTSDIHIPMYARDAYHMLTLPLPKIDVLFIAGDLTKKAVYQPFIEWYEKMMHVWKPSLVIAVWGNADKEPVRKHLPKALPDIIFLEDETYTLGNFTIVGTEGVLDRPTSWQMRNIPDIQERYEKRIEWIKQAVKEAKTPYTILLSHYGVCGNTIEETHDKGGLTSMRLCDALRDNPPTITIHGHSHHARVWKTENPFLIYNVALPIHGKPLLIDADTLEEVQVGLFA